MVSIVIKCHDQQRLREERVYLYQLIPLRSHSITDGGQGRTQGRKKPGGEGSGGVGLDACPAGFAQLAL